MQQISSLQEIIPLFLDLKNKTTYDVGCGIGEMTRWMQQQGAMVTGLDKPEIIAQAILQSNDSRVEFIAASAENLPFENETADIVTCFSSFHHVPTTSMNTAINEFCRVLKPNGILLFNEPVAEQGSWYEITKFFEEEEFVRWVAYETIKNAASDNFSMKSESFYYMERSLEHFKPHIEIYVKDAERKAKILSQATARFNELAAIDGIPTGNFSLKSISRLNILAKK